MKSRAASLVSSRSSAQPSSPSTPTFTPKAQQFFFIEASEGPNQLSSRETGEMEDDTQHGDRGSNVTNSEDEESSGEDSEEDEKMGPNAKKPEDAPFADWDNGEPLMPEERAQIMKLSAYERAREMNIRKRKRMEADLVSELRTLTDAAKQSYSNPAPAQRKPKTKAPSSNENLRRSSRAGRAK
jgi:hypothetical protein